MLLDSFEFCPTLVDILKSRRVVGRSGKVFEGLVALSSLNNLFVLQKLMREKKPRRTLEIGLCFGGSGLLLTACHRELGSTPAGQHTALDPFQNDVWDDAGLLAIERAGLLPFFDFRPEKSSVELPRLLASGKTFDLVYIDGSHLFEDVFVDAYFGTRLLNQGGILLFDDSTDPHVRKVIKFIRKTLSSSLSEIDLTAYRSSESIDFKYRIASLFGKVQMTAFQRSGDPVRRWDAPFCRF